MLQHDDLWQTVFWNNYTIWIVSLGSCILGVVSGALGTFAMLRRQSLLGDAISHSALAGLALAYLLTGSHSTFVLLLGAGLAGWIATLLFLGIVRSSRIKEDTALGTVMSVLFGLGLMLLTYIVRNDPGAAQAGLSRFLFGQAATMRTEDIAAMLLLGGVAGALLLAFWKEFKLLCFDREFGATLGLPQGRLEVLLTGLLVLAILVGLRAVGVVLMSALLIAPAAAARQWTDRLGRMVLLAMLFGALAGLGGALTSDQLSTTTRKLPTGPTIVVLASAMVFLSLMLAPNRGLLWNWLAQRARHRQLRLEAVLGDLYDLAARHDFREHPHAIAVLRALGPSRGDVSATLAQLATLGWARQIGDDWLLTPEGKAEAERRSQQH